MSQVRLVSIDRVISGVYRDLQPVIDLNENDLIEWAGEALEFIGAYSQMVEKVEYLLVQDHRALIPCGLHKIVQTYLQYVEVIEFLDQDLLLYLPLAVVQLA